MADSPICTICSAVETVEHQLLECPNAARLWTSYRDLTGINIQALPDILLCNSSIENEILKSALIKALLQINRSHGIPVGVIAKDCSYFLRIEAIMNPVNETRLVELNRKVNGMV